MRFGIDFGTTHTVVSLVDRGNYPVVAFEWGDAMPSLAALRPADGALRFGQEALAVADEPEWETIRSFKRLLATATHEDELHVGGRTVLLSDLLEGYLGHLREELFQRSNAGLKRNEPVQIAVSVPANASNDQRFLTLDAFQHAGFEVLALLNEPSAAGFEYAHRFRNTVTSKREYVLVYDLGGGTFDCSLIHMAGKANEVITSAGVSRLGGDDFDEAMLALVALRAELGHLTRARRRALLEECRRQKESVGPNTKRVVVDLEVVGKEPLVLPIEQVYAACTPMVVRTLETLDEVMRDPRRQDQDVDWNELAGLYVVGGASSFPLVYRYLRERFGERRVRRSPHPFAATAIGLANFLDEDAGYQLSESLSRHFGVFREAEGGREVSFDPIFEKDLRLPGPGEPPHESVRRYRAAHNLGHFRFVECSRVRDRVPDGDVSPWDEIRFPFDPSLRGVDDLRGVTVQRFSSEGPEIEERYRCTSAGTFEVTLTALHDGYTQTWRMARRAKKDGRARRRRGDAADLGASPA